MYSNACYSTEALSAVKPDPVSPRKIFVVDDHPIMRKGFKALVQQEPDLMICGEAAGGDEALELMDRDNTDLVITDISMSGCDGLELTKSLKESYPDLPVLVVSSHDRETYSSRALEAGARGFIEKRYLSLSGLSIIRCALSKNSCSQCPFLTSA